MLYATPLERKLTPIVRYRVGDKARWLKEKCACGRSTPLFELLGRGDDVLRIGYDSVDYDFIQKIVAQIPQASSQIQMEKKRIDGKDLLIIRIETSALIERQPDMTSKLEKLFLEARPSFSEFLKKGTVLPLKIEWMSIGGIKQNSRTGKLIRVIDAK